MAVFAYRVITQGIADAIRHARPTEVLIRCAMDGSQLTVSVTDDGQSSADIVPGVGLQSLVDRAREVGREPSLTPVAPSGTRLSLTIPSCPR
jgi:signal transduction histidine kinase